MNGITCICGKTFDNDPNYLRHLAAKPKCQREPELRKKKKKKKKKRTAKISRTTGADVTEEGEWVTDQENVCGCFFFPSFYSEKHL